MSKFKKIDKEYLLTDSSVNSYGYRLLTSGYLMAEYQKNPIGYYMHKDRENGVVVKWEDLRMDGDQVFGKPVINLSHERGQRTVDEIESGFLNAASFGHFVVLEVSDKPEDYLDGQTGPTVSKWFNRECSLVDIPGNYNALADLFDAKGNPLKLEDLADLKPQNVKMKQIFLTPAQLQLMNLKADAEASVVETTIQNLVAKAAKVDDLSAQLITSNAAKAQAESDLAVLKKATIDKEVEDLIAKGKADKKLTVESANKLKDLFAGKPKELKELIDTMQAYIPVTSQMADAGAGEDEKLTYADLDKQGKLENLKAKNPELFKTKFKEQFGVEYTK